MLVVDFPTPPFRLAIESTRRPVQSSCFIGNCIHHNPLQVFLDLLLGGPIKSGGHKLIRHRIVSTCTSRPSIHMPLVRVMRCSECHDPNPQTVCRIQYLIKHNRRAISIVDRLKNQPSIMPETALCARFMRSLNIQPAGSFHFKRMQVCSNKRNISAFCDGQRCQIWTRPGTIRFAAHCRYISRENLRRMCTCLSRKNTWKTHSQKPVHVYVQLAFYEYLGQFRTSQSLLCINHSTGTGINIFLLPHPNTTRTP